MANFFFYSYSSFCFLLFSMTKLLQLGVDLSVRKSREKSGTNIWKFKASLWRNSLSTGTPQKSFKYNPLFCSFSLPVIFFSKQPFYGNHSTLDSHTSTVISHTFAYSSRWRRKPRQGLFDLFGKMLTTRKLKIFAIFS